MLSVDCRYIKGNSCTIRLCRVDSLPPRMPNNLQIYPHEPTHRFRMPPLKFRLFSIKINENLKIGYLTFFSESGYISLSRIDKAGPFLMRALYYSSISQLFKKIFPNFSQHFLNKFSSFTKSFCESPKIVSSFSSNFLKFFSSFSNFAPPKGVGGLDGLMSAISSLNTPSTAAVLFDRTVGPY